jgi:hypothetical protein
MRLAMFDDLWTNKPIKTAEFDHDKYVEGYYDYVPQKYVNYTEDPEFYEESIEGMLYV